MRDHSRDDTEAHGLGRVESPRRQQEVAGHRHTDVRGQHRRIGRVRNAAQQLRRTERRSIAGHRDVGEHGDQQAAGLADAVDGRDHGRLAVADGQERQHVVADLVGHRFSRFGAPAEVAPRCEDIVGAGDDQRREIGVGVDEPHRSLEAVVHGGRQRVPSRGPVDHTPRERALALQAKARRAEVVGHDDPRPCSSGAPCTRRSRPDACAPRRPACRRARWRRRLPPRNAGRSPSPLRRRRSRPAWARRPRVRSGSGWDGSPTCRRSRAGWHATRSADTRRDPGTRDTARRWHRCRRPEPRSAPGTARSARSRRGTRLRGRSCRRPAPVGKPTDHLHRR